MTRPTNTPYSPSAQQREDTRNADIIERLHKLDRTHYDTPASIQECACAECNAARLLHHKRPRRWHD